MRAPALPRPTLRLLEAASWRCSLAPSFSRPSDCSTDQSSGARRRGIPATEQIPQDRLVRRRSTSPGILAGPDDLRDRLRRAELGPSPEIRGKPSRQGGLPGRRGSFRSRTRPLHDRRYQPARGGGTPAVVSPPPNEGRAVSLPHPPYRHQPPAPVPATLNAFAVAALVTSLLCLAPLGLVFGIVALVQISGRGQRGGRLLPEARTARS